MAIKFEELRKYVARNVRLSICFEDGYYHDYLMMSDIPEQKYAGFYIYGVGMVDVEFFQRCLYGFAGTGRRMLVQQR